MEPLLICLHKEHCKWQDKLTASLIVSDDFTTLLPTAVVPVRTNQPGRPSLSLNMDTIVFLRSINFKWIDIAKMLGVSRSTLYRKYKEAGLSESGNEAVSYNTLLPIVSDIKKQFPDLGNDYYIHGMVHARGTTCTSVLVKLLEK